uniref:Cell growth regulator with EF hand domain protein 1 n=1 Tax=Cyanoderma ruficeps TaxID=181631 RepID=A0A8C3RHH7_9PASS
MRNPPVMLILLLLLGPAAWAAPRAGTNRYGGGHSSGGTGMGGTQGKGKMWCFHGDRGTGAVRDGHGRVAVALLYLFVLHDHDQSRRLDGLELLQLLATVLAQAGDHWAGQDLNGDGLLDPSELLDPPKMPLPGQDQGPPAQPLLEEQAEVEAVPGGGTEMLRQDLGLGSPGQAATEAGEPQTGDPEEGAPKVESLKVESPNAEALEEEVIPGAEASSTDATEEEEAPEAEASEEQAAPAWRDHGEG